MSTRKSGWVQGRALLLVALILFSAFSVGVGYGLTLNGTWSGDWFTEKYGNFTSGLRLPFLTAGRIPIVGTSDLITDDVDLSYNSATNTLTVPNIVVTNASNVYQSYVNSNLYTTDQPYSFLIIGSGPYYAKNGVTGAITSNANFNTLLNAVYAATPTWGTIYIKGDKTFTSPLTILKSINIIMDGNVTADNTDLLIIGDAPNFVIGYNIKLNMVDGLDNTQDCIVLRDATAGIITFNHIRRFDKAIYLDPVGTGCGENQIVGGWIAACNRGIASNPLGALWAQGNRIEASIYASYEYGIYLNCTIPLYYQDTHFRGTVDSIIGIYPPIPSAGGGIDIYDTEGYNFFELLWANTGNTIPSSSVLFSSSGLDPKTSLGTKSIYFGSTCIVKSGSPVISFNDTWGSNSVIRMNSVAFPSTYDGWKPPQYIKIVIGGTVGAETISVALQYGYRGAGLGASLTKTFTATGTYYLTNGELMELLVNDFYFYEVNFYAKTTAASTSATVTVTCAGVEP